MGTVGQTLAAGRDEDLELQMSEMGSVGQSVVTGRAIALPVSYQSPTPVVFDDSSSMYDDTSTAPQLLLNVKSVKTESFLWIRKVLLLAILFSVSCSMVFALFLSLPKVGTPQVEQEQRLLDGAGGQTDAENVVDRGLEREEAVLLLKVPKDLEQLRVVRKTLILYQKEHRTQVQLGVICLYLFLQAYMIPGSIFLNILAGSLYGFYEAVILVTLLASLGSALCYCLSNCILKEILYYYFPDRCEWFAREVHRHRHNLFYYILFLRLTPLLPNWFINVGSPLVSIPFREFFVGTFVGVIPAGVISVKAGSILSQIDSLSDLYDVKTILTLAIIAVVSILPVVLKSRLDRFRYPMKKT